MTVPKAPIQVIFSPRIKKAKMIVTTGIRYNPFVIFTVPRMLQALFQEVKQNPLAISPKNKR